MLHKAVPERRKYVWTRVRPNPPLIYSSGLSISPTYKISRSNYEIDLDNSIKISLSSKLGKHSDLIYFRLY